MANEYPSKQVDEQSTKYPSAPREPKPRVEVWDDAVDAAELYYAAMAGDELAYEILTRGC
jgi:hypothetical protein